VTTGLNLSEQVQKAAANQKIVAEELKTISRSRVMEKEQARAWGGRRQ